ncbi:ribbon-helix-helix domain-containing protein [Azospirillum cavernae]|nr:ribbon-helix-helix domain-containing protein [Azospirillum cavernae]
MNEKMSTASGDGEGAGRKTRGRESKLSLPAGKPLSPMMEAALGQVRQDFDITPGRCIKIDGRRTSIRLQDPLWDALKDISKREGRGIDSLCTEVARMRPKGLTVSGAVRLFITRYFREAAGSVKTE